jgi:hypothetical protein
VRRGKEPLKIFLPHLTLREKHWLDTRLGRKLTLKALAFELENQSLLDNYRKFYKEYPTYAEALL